jgi:hypothetical protein
MGTNEPIVSHKKVVMGSSRLFLRLQAEPAALVFPTGAGNVENHANILQRGFMAAPVTATARHCGDFTYRISIFCSAIQSP